ncbi:MAG: T9SS type A sorting domain-containing protein [Bacteroidota bacterium]
MKKNLLLMAAIFAGAASYAQECTAVATVDEDFSDFTVGTAWAGENCWNKIALGFAGGGGMIYTAEDAEPANTYINYYAAVAVNAYSYLSGPEVSTFNGTHELSFTTWKIASNGSVPAGNVTLQIGTMTNVADATTFVAFGTPYVITSENIVTSKATFSNIVIPSAAAGSHIAFRLSADTAHNALAIDDVTWSEVEVTEPACEAVAFIDEDFTEFEAFEDNCWSIIANGFPAGPAVYVDGDDENEFVTFYAANSANTDAYLITPEVSTFDASHSLSFDAWRVAMGPTVPGTVTIQVGTITDGTATFVPVTTGGSFTLTSATSAPYTVAIPSAPAGSHIAFRITGDTPHNAASIDNVAWTTTAATENFAKGAFAMFPNPTANKNVTLAFNANTAAEFVSVYTLTGAKVFEAAVTGTTSQNLNLSALSSGMYIVKVQAGNASVSQKLVIQ